MRKRVNDINSLKLAKLELRNDLELRGARIELEYTRLKEHYLHTNRISDSGESGGIFSFVPAGIRPIIGNFLIHKLAKKKGKFSSILIRVLVSTFLK